MRLYYLPLWLNKGNFRESQGKQQSNSFLIKEMQTRMHSSRIRIPPALMVTTRCQYWGIPYPPLGSCQPPTSGTIPRERTWDQTESDIIPPKRTWDQTGSDIKSSERT